METPVKDEGTDGLGYTKLSHPAFGMIGLSQVSSTGAVLVGSSVKHQHCLELTIKEATRHKDNYHEHWMGGPTVCKVALSHSQLAEMLSISIMEMAFPVPLNLYGETLAEDLPLLLIPRLKRAGMI